MDVDPFWWKVIVMGFVLTASTFLFAWVGFQMARLYSSWWPIKVDEQSVLSATIVGLPREQTTQQAADAPTQPAAGAKTVALDEQKQDS